ncbi:MAG: purine-nucleoside phosphorylase [Lachnospiraceae bacterium]|nr:purine-nucleoside phosphorylase [Lachnospiraceae bacterium]
MNKEFERIQNCLEAIRDITDFVPKVALVLGSGLGNYASELNVECEISYSDIPGFPVSTAPGHEGKFIFGTVGNVPVVCMKGRVHYYEGYDMEDVVLPIRIMGLLGAQLLFLTNASGGIKQGFKPGDLMLIRDQISFFVPSPLRGENIKGLGTRFPDMSHIYDPDFSDKIVKCAVSRDILLKEGIYVQTKGPNYESPAEIALCRTMGADAVGMSTACEAIAARHMNMKVVGVSCIANLAAGISPTPLSEQDVIDAAEAASEKFTTLVTVAIKELGGELK